MLGPDGAGAVGDGDPSSALKGQSVQEKINQGTKKILVIDHLIFAYDILRDPGLGTSPGTFVSCLFKDFTNRPASGKQKLCGLYEAHRHCLNMESNLKCKPRTQGQVLCI